MVPETKLDLGDKVFQFDLAAQAAKAEAALRRVRLRMAFHAPVDVVARGQAWSFLADAVEALEAAAGLLRPEQGEPKASEPAAEPCLPQ